MSVIILAVMWPQQGVAVFIILATIPPIIALIRGRIASFAASMLMGAIAVLLARYAYLVPIAIVLLIFAFGIALRSMRFERGQRSAGFYIRRGAVILSSLLVIAIAGYVLRLSLIYNWSPPQIFEKALEPGLTDVDDALTEALAAQFPLGGDEGALVLALSKQGFVNVQRPHPRCRQPAEPGTTLRYYAPCPPGSKEMTYEYEALGLFCGTHHIRVNWSTDPNGKITRSAATGSRACF